MVYSDEDDPFLFDEQQLRYEGYDDGVQRGSSQWYTHNLSRSNPSSSRQTGPYKLPAPPASSRPRLSYDDTPIKDYSGAHMPNSEKLRILSTSSEALDLSPRRNQSSSPTAMSNIDAVMNYQEPSRGFTPTTSPFFNETAITNHTPFINDSSMPVLGGIELVSVGELPDRLRLLFPHHVFNRMQSRCFKTAYGCDDNLVVSAPTASGKTTIFELAICRVITKMDTTNIKIVYIGPTKALCEERNEDWSNKFRHLGIKCGLLTGDSDSNQQEILKQSQLIVTTPEKWDSITRKWHDQDKLMQLVRLLLIDEVHILNEDRGATVEVVVTRMKSAGKDVRLIALSATVPNSIDVAAWLGRNSKDRSSPAHLQVFGDEFRPCILQKFVYPIEARGEQNNFKLDHCINSQIPTYIRQHGIGKPIMVFCSTRKSAESTAKFLAEVWRKNSRQPWPGMPNVSRVKEEDLRNLLEAGVAYHHAGLSLEDRKYIEKAYLDGRLTTICCTSTLAIGVNLPCHLIIIKNTVKWVDNTWSEYNDLDIIQMLGRAGRPQFGDQGVGIILTRPENVAKYEQMAEGTKLLESHLHLNLIEHLNAEIVLGTIKSLEDAKSWLKSTFFFVRLQKNPEHYSLDDFPRDLNIDQLLKHICTTRISELRQHNMIEAAIYKATEFGELMAKQYIRFKTMISFVNMHCGSNVNDVLATLCSVEDMRDLKLDYRKTSLCKACVSSVDTKHYSFTQDKHGEKLASIVQSVLSRVVHRPDMASKCSNSQHHPERLPLFSRLRHLVHCLVDCRQILHDGISMGSALQLSRSLAAEAWDDSPLAMMQLQSVGRNTVYHLSEGLGVKNVDDLKTRPVEQLNRCGRSSLFGAKLLSYARGFPDLRIAASLQHKEPMGGYPSIYCRTEVGFLNDDIPKTFRKNKVTLRLLVLRSDGHLVLHKHIQNTSRPSEMAICFSVKLEEHGQKVICQVSCDEIAGTLKEVVIDPDIPAHKFASRQNLEKSQSHTSMAPAAQATSKRSSENDEFTDEDLDAEDFLAAESGDSMPIDNVAIVKKPKIGTLSKQQLVGNMPKHPTYTNDIRVARKVANPVAAKTPSSNNYKEPCKHPCKDKSRCGHSCCQNGLNKRRVRKNESQKDISGNHKGKFKEKNSATKLTQSTDPNPNNHQASKLLAKVTKPSTLDSYISSGLDKIHNSAKGHTPSISLLGRNPAITNEQYGAPPIPNSRDVVSTNEFDRDISEDNTDLDIRMPSSRPDSNFPSTKKTALVQVQDQIKRRTPHRRLLDVSSDSELDDFEQQTARHRAFPGPAEKRKADTIIHESSKKICTGNRTGYSDSSALSPQASTSITFDNHISNSIAIRDHKQATNIPPQSARDEVAEMSQEIASYRPFRDAESSVMDFMAQFEDCCEFIE